MADKQEDSIVTPNMRIFQHHPNPQNGSRLIRLPAELRVKILRNLLKKPSPIQSLAERDPANNDARAQYDADTSLSSQVLRTCQIAYNEGLLILYKENIIQLHIREDSDNSCELGSFDLTIRYPLDADDISMHQDALLEFAGNAEHCDNCVTISECVGSFPAYCENPACEGYYKNSGKDLVDQYPVLQQFTHIRLVLSWMSNKNGVFVVACRALRDLLRGKHVSISFSLTLSRYYPGVTSRDIDPDQARVLRCASISFEEIGGPHVDMVKSLICSNAPVYDTHAMWRSLMQGVISKLPNVGDLNFADRHKGVIEQLKSRSMSYSLDADAFKKERDKIMQLVKQWWDEYFEHEDGKAIKAKV